jgi:hypothetical protein
VTPRVLHAAIVGWSSSDPATRCIGYHPGPNFWTRYAAQVIDPQRKANPMVPVMLWNPGGCLPNETMQFSQMLQAERSGLSWLFADLAKTIHRLAHEGGELTFYVGGEGGDRLIKSYYANSTKDRLIRDAMKHFPRCVGIAVDAASGLSPGSRVYQWMCNEQDAGRKVYSEALPPTASTHLHRFPAIATRWFLNHHDRPYWGVTEDVPEVIECYFDAVLTEQDISDAHAKGRSIAGCVAA